MKNFTLILFCSALLFSCGSSNQSTASEESAKSDKTADTESTTPKRSYVKDVHSQAIPDQIAVDHISLDIALDFAEIYILGVKRPDLPGVTGDFDFMAREQFFGNDNDTGRRSADNASVCHERKTAVAPVCQFASSSRGCSPPVSRCNRYCHDSCR